MLPSSVMPPFVTRHFSFSVRRHPTIMLLLFVVVYASTLGGNSFLCFFENVAHFCTHFSTHPTFHMFL